MHLASLTLIKTVFLYERRASNKLFPAGLSLIRQKGGFATQLTLWRSNKNHLVFLLDPLDASDERNGGSNFLHSDSFNGNRERGP